MVQKLQGERVRPLTVTEFQNKFSKNGQLVTTQWIDLITELQQVGHIQLHDKEVGAAIVGGPSTDGRHRKKSFKKIDVLIFDCDFVTLKTLKDWLQSNFAGFAWFLYSTYSNQWFAGKYRVMFPCARSIPFAEYFDIWNSIDIPGKDEQTKDVSRLAYLPSTQNGNACAMLASATSDRFFDFLEIPDGTRNSKIAQLVGGWCNGKKITKEVLLKKAKKTNQDRCNPPLPDEVIETIVESIFATEMEARENGKQVFSDKKDTKSKIAVDLVLGKVELFKGDGNEAIAKLENTYYLVESVIFESWLTKLYFDTFEDTIGRASYNDAIHTLKGLALSGKDEIKVFRRIGYNEEQQTLVYFLGDKNYVHINNRGWRIVRDDSCGLCFIRENNFQVCDLPVNEDPANLWGLLRPFFNVADEDFLLILCWIIGSFWSKGPFPILLKVGEQGSAKSSGSEFCAQIVDPRNPLLIKPPKDSDNLYVSAHGRHALTIDNVSFITDDLSDDLCRIATGAGFEKRKLYTDNDTVSYTGARPLILNSILSTIVGRGDLLDRAIVVNYLPIAKYKAKDDIDKNLKDVLPRIHGAIFSILVQVLKNLPNIKDHMVFSRMANFEKRMKSIPLNWAQNFTSVYYSNKINAEINYVAGDEVYEAMINFFDNNNLGYWEGLISDFSQKLNFRYESKFKNAKALGRHIERIKPNLRKVGIFVDKKRKKAGMNYCINYVGVENENNG